MGNSLSRRRLLGGMALASLGVGQAIPAQAGDLTLGSPADVLSALVKMRGRLDEKLAYIWLRGVQYTLIDGIARPMCGYLGGGITRYRRLDDDMYEFVAPDEWGTAPIDFCNSRLSCGWARLIRRLWSSRVRRS